MKPRPQTYQSPGTTNNEQHKTVRLQKKSGIDYSHDVFREM